MLVQWRSSHPVLLSSAKLFCSDLHWQAFYDKNSNCISNDHFLFYFQHYQKKKKANNNSCNSNKRINTQSRRASHSTQRISHAHSRDCRGRIQVLCSQDSHCRVSFYLTRLSFYSSLTYSLPTSHLRLSLSNQIWSSLQCNHWTQWIRKIKYSRLNLLRTRNHELVSSKSRQPLWTRLQTGTGRSQ